MRRIPRVLFGGTFMAILVLGASASRAKSWVETIPASKKSRVEVVLQTGDVKVIGWDRDELKVETGGEFGPSLKVEGDTIRIGASAAREPEAEQSGKELGKRIQDVLGFGAGFSAQDISLHLPREASLSVATISGDILVEKLDGRCRLKTVSGDLAVRSCRGEVGVSSVSGNISIKAATSGLSLASVSGDVDAEAVEGALVEVKTISGEIRLREMKASRLRLKSQSGDIHFRGSLPAEGSLQAKTLSGDIVVDLPQDSGFDLQASSRSGEVRVGFDLKDPEKSKTAVNGRAGSGGAEVQLMSFSGDLEVHPGKYTEERRKGNTP